MHVRESPGTIDQVDEGLKIQEADSRGNKCSNSSATHFSSEQDNHTNPTQSCSGAASTSSWFWRGIGKGVTHDIETWIEELKQSVTSQVNRCNLHSGRFKVRAGRAAWTEKGAVRVSMCARTWLPQSCVSPKLVLGHYRAPNRCVQKPGKYLRLNWQILVVLWCPFLLCQTVVKCHEHRRPRLAMAVCHWRHDVTGRYWRGYCNLFQLLPAQQYTLHTRWSCTPHE